MSVAAEKLCSESVQPYLGSILDELMEPVSSGFQEGRALSENMMDQVCQDVQLGGANEQLKQVCSDLSSLSLSKRKLGEVRRSANITRTFMDSCLESQHVKVSVVDLSKL